MESTIQEEETEITILALDFKVKIKMFHKESVLIKAKNKIEHYRTIKKKLETPLLDVYFKATIDKKLEVGCGYRDGKYAYTAVSENEIILRTNCVESFEIPKYLFMFYKPFTF
jgi:hypothetical protein